MKSIDLNADLGEGQGFDLELLNIVSSASIACGGHAGSDAIMATTLLAAKRAGVTTGAHPGFEDRKNFGRVRLDIPVEKIVAQVVGQLRTILSIANNIGQPISYVKLHGALYNHASEDLDFATQIFGAIRNFDASLAILALDGSSQIEAANSLGLRTIKEAFVDRAYDKDGLLVSRSVAGAVFKEPEMAVAQAVDIATNGIIVASDGTRISTSAQSMCLHGDNLAALTLARAVRDGLNGAGITIQAPT